MSNKKNKKLWIAGGIILVLVLIIARTGLSNTNNTTSVKSSNNISTIQNDTQSNISSKNASVYINEILTVCGPVVDSRYSSASKGQPTFLNFDEAYPNHIFTAVIWGDSRKEFKFKPEKRFEGKEVCVEGIIKTFKDKPQIIVRNSEQISIVKTKKKKSNK